MLFAKSVTPQERLVDCNGGLSAFSYGDRDKKDVARHITCNIDTGNAAFFGVRIDDDASFFITRAPETFGQVRRLMAASRKK